MKSVGVNDQSGVAEARRAATDLAGRTGFTEVEIGKLALITTELSTNLVKHGSGGEILVGNYEDNDSQGIEILALDKGAGMRNIAVVNPQLLIIDFAMPGANGAEVVKAARAAQPSLAVLFVSGYADSAALEAAMGSAPFLRKPFLPAELAHAVRSALELQDQAPGKA